MPKDFASSFRLAKLVITMVAKSARRESAYFSILRDSVRGSERLRETVRGCERL